MITFNQLLSENTFYSNENEKFDFVQNESNVIAALIYNYFGIIGLLGTAENNQPIKTYFKSDKALRLKNITDRNNNSSLSVKLANDLNFFRNERHAENMTKFLAKLKTGKVDEIDVVAFGDMLSFSPTGKKALKTHPKLNKLVNEFTMVSDVLPDNKILVDFVHGLKQEMLKIDTILVGDFKVQSKKVKLPKSDIEKAKEWTLLDYETAWVAGDKDKMDEIKNDWNTARNDFDSVNKFDEFQEIFLDGDSTSVKLKNVKELTAEEVSEYLNLQTSLDDLHDLVNKRDISPRKNIHKLLVNAIGMSKWNKEFWLMVFQSQVDDVMADNFYAMLMNFHKLVKSYYPTYIMDIIERTNPNDFDRIFDLLNEITQDLTKEEALKLDKKQLDQAISYFENSTWGTSSDFFFVEVLAQNNRPLILNNGSSLNKNYAKKIVDAVPDNRIESFYEELGSLILGRLFVGDSGFKGKKLVSEIVNLNPDQFTKKMTLDKDLFKLTERLTAETSEKLIPSLLSNVPSDIYNTETAKNIKIVKTLLNKKILEGGNYNQIFKKYFPDGTDQDKNEFLNSLLIDIFPKVDVEKMNKTKMDMLLNDYNPNMFSKSPDLYKSFLMLGIFDYITPSQNNELMRQINDGSWEYFDDMGILSDTLQDRLAQTNMKMLSDSLDTQPDEVNEYYESKDKGTRVMINNYFQGWNLLSNQITEGVIPSFSGNVDRYELKNMMDYNNLDYQEVYKKSKSQKRKNETLTDYISRMDRFVKEGRIGLAEPKVSPLDETDEQLKERAIKLQDDYRNENHGPNHLKILKTYQINFPVSEYEEFVELMRNEGIGKSLIPAFTGTSGVAANMILRYGFALLPRNADGTTGRALGEGIYLAKNIDKVQQYIGNTYSGSARKIGTKGYIIHAEAELGENGVNYEEAGTGSDNDLHSNFRSAEWAVKEPQKQIKMMKLYQVELISINDWKEMKGLNETIGFGQFLNEGIENQPMNQVSFTIHDNQIFLPGGSIKEFEAINHKLLPKNMSVVKERNYCRVIFTKVNKTVYYDTRWCSSMATKTRNHYFQLMNR